ncbi:MAG TPA: polyprenyl synthetase family protein [Oligoflexia bacterium]|nr:polyprenyl synthetase family protein [Oligoflexia bacterium]HMP27766.1 polyprenyl synthetase family protein [Oligoflexia bacterium]
MSKAFKHSSQVKGEFDFNVDLEEVASIIEAAFVSDAPLLSEISNYLYNLGGKRIRPTFCYLIAELLGGKADQRKLAEVAAGIELIHMATLLHDDIVDNASLRRGKTAPPVRYGIGNAIITGDFLLTRAFSLCAKLDDFIIDSTEEACVGLTEGEIMETPLYEKRHTLDEALLIADKKTASLFWLAARAAAHLSEVDGKTLVHLSAAGRALGIAFQILDDILDVIADQKTLGKEIGSDIRDRKPSILNILWLDRGTPLSLRLLQTPAEDNELYLAQSIAELKGECQSVIAEAKDLARGYARKSNEYLLEATVGLECCDQVALAKIQGLIDFTLSRLS